MFRGCTGAGTDLFNAWETGTGASTVNGVLSGSPSDTCSGHERASIVDMWSDLAVQQASVHEY